MTKVLLVEDDNNLREIFELRLQAEGYQTLTAGDGEQALVTAMKEKPDLIIADVMMPKLSGFEMLESLRAAPEMADSKVIMMTALGQAEDQARGAKLGVVKYLVKSQVTLEDFVRVVREVLAPDQGTPGSPGTTVTESAKQGSSVTNNKEESEQSMDDTTPINPAMPTPDGDNASANPAGGTTPTDMGAGDQQSSADEQSTVNSQINDFAASAPTAPMADSGVPAMPGSASVTGTEHDDVPVATPPPADTAPASDLTDPAAPTAPPTTGTL